MRSFGVPVEAAARPQPVDRSRSRHRTFADDYQNRGVGTLFLQRLVDARAGGVRALRMCWKTIERCSKSFEARNFRADQCPRTASAVSS